MASPLHSLKLRLPTFFDPDRRVMFALSSVASPLWLERTLVTSPVRWSVLGLCFGALRAAGAPAEAISSTDAAVAIAVRRNRWWVRAGAPV